MTQNVFNSVAWVGLGILGIPTVPLGFVPRLLFVTVDRESQSPVIRRSPDTLIAYLSPAIS